MKHVIPVLTSSILLGIISAATCSAQEGGLDPTIRSGATEKVSEHVYLIPDEKKPIVPNVGFVVGEKTTLVIDTGLGMTNGQIVLVEAQKLSDTARFYVAATHTHPEHDLGAMAFPEDATVVRSVGQELDIEELGMGLAERFATFSARTAELLEGAYIRASDIVFEGAVTLDLGGVHVRILEVGPTHTRGDLAFLVEEDGVLFTGDVVMNEFPMPLSSTSSVRRWLDALDELEALNPTLIIPSHYSTGTKDMIAVYRDFFTTVQSRVDALATDGKTVEEVEQVLRTELAAKFSSWSDPGRIARTIAVAFRERGK